MSPQLKQRIMSAHYVLTLHQTPVNPGSRVQTQRTYVLSLSHEEAEALIEEVNARKPLHRSSPLTPILNDLSNALYGTDASTGIHVDPDA